MEMAKFTKCYNEYRSLVIKVAYSVLKDMDLAQDVCQDTFIKLFERIDELDEETIKAWLVICAKRRAVDYCRKISKQKELHETVGLKSQQSLQFCSDDIADVICAEESTSDLFLKLWNESEEWFEIITRVCINNEEPQSVARDLNLSIGNLRIKLHRARNWARNELNKT